MWPEDGIINPARSASLGTFLISRRGLSWGGWLGTIPVPRQLRLMRCGVGGGRGSRSASALSPCRRSRVRRSPGRASFPPAPGFSGPGMRRVVGSHPCPLAWGGCAAPVLAQGRGSLGSHPCPRCGLGLVKGRVTLLASRRARVLGALPPGPAQLLIPPDGCRALPGTGHGWHRWGTARHLRPPEEVLLGTSAALGHESHRGNFGVKARHLHPRAAGCVCCHAGLGGGSGAQKVLPHSRQRSSEGCGSW